MSPSADPYRIPGCHCLLKIHHIIQKIREAVATARPKFSSFPFVLQYVIFIVVLLSYVLVVVVVGDVPQYLLWGRSPDGYRGFESMVVALVGVAACCRHLNVAFIMKAAFFCTIILP